MRINPFCCWLACLLLMAVMGQGCCPPSRVAADAPVSTIFTTGKPVQIVVNTQPYELTDVALSSLQSFFTDSLGLEAQVSRVNLEDVTKSDSTQQDLFNAAVPVLKEAQAPTVVIFVVGSIRDFHGGGNCMAGETRYESGEHYPVAVVVLEHSWFLRKQLETYLLKHEVGHWVGVPARDFHTLKNNASHCCSLRCVMMPGPGTDPLRCGLGAVLSVLFLSPPDFCKNCKAELAQMKTLHK